MNSDGLLAGLDDVAWSRLEHAYGPATDVPDMLRAVAEGDDASRDKAISDLFGSICHQGDVYEAAGPSVPFIAHLALDAAMTSGHRRLLVALLGHVAAGDEEAREAVSHQFPALLARLAGADPRMNWNLAFAASQVPEAAAPATALVDSLVGTTGDPQLLAALVLTRALVAGSSPTAAAELAAESLRDDDLGQSEDVRGEDPERWPRSLAGLLFEEGFEQEDVR
jgi:hypothetical protein